MRNAPKKVTRGTKVKLIGAALLLFSYATQNFLYDKWDGEARLLNDSYQRAVMLDHSVALDELLYLTMTPTGDPSFDQKIKLIKLRKAAVSYVQDTSIGLTLAGTQDWSQFNQLASGAQSVSDYKSYTEFKRSFNALEHPAFEQNMKRATVLELERRTARFFYLALYLVGGILAISGEIIANRPNG